MNIIQKVRALLAVRKAFSKIQEAAMKSGWKSTEFWLNLVGIVASVWSAVGGFIPPALAVKIAAVLLIAYTLARTLVKVAEVVVKLTATNKDDIVVSGINQVLNKIEEVFKPKIEEKPNA